MTRRDLFRRFVTVAACIVAPWQSRSQTADDFHGIQRLIAATPTTNTVRGVSRASFQSRPLTFRGAPLMYDEDANTVIFVSKETPELWKARYGECALNMT